MTFVPKKQLQEALGVFQNPKQQKYYGQMAKIFTPMGIPKPGDWLQSHKQVHQAYQKYQLPLYNKVTPERKTIYIQPFGQFSPDFIARLIRFCQAFYPLMLVQCLPSLDFATELPKIKCRQNMFGPQYLAQDILAYLQNNVPKKAYCVMGITLNDIYPGDSWNFVYGWAMYKSRVGIFSFLRWDDDFAFKRTKQINWEDILYPSIRTMVHEIGHMYAITHCVYYRCLMNGFNHIDQNYKNPLQFCPICFRKIVTNIEFDIKKRYIGLIECLKTLKIKSSQKDIQFYSTLLQIGQKNEFVQRPQIQKKIQHEFKKVQPTMKINQFQAKNARGKSLQVGIRRR